MKVKRLNKILEMLFEETNVLINEGGDLPVLWDIMHLYSSLQVAKIIAMKRGLDFEIAAIAAALHDVAVVVTKKTEDHAKNGEKYARQIIHDYNQTITNDKFLITNSELEIIANSVEKHSEVEIFSEDSYAELLKDVDSFDKYLHGIETNGYFLMRSKKVIEELGLQN
jgi:uncharacterized protein